MQESPLKIFSSRGLTRVQKAVQSVQRGSGGATRRDKRRM